MTARVACEHCGEPFAPKLNRNGTWQRFCSDNCRKRACECRSRGRCVDCGNTLGQGSPWGSRGNERCVPCERALRTRGHEERLNDIQAMYEAGMPVRQIARELGYGPNSVPPELTELRRLGRIGYRNRGYGEAA